MRKRNRAGSLAIAALAAIGGASAAAAAEIAVSVIGDALHSPGCATTGRAPCTLRDAITFANARPGRDTITFAIGSGPVSIPLASPLPPITDPVVLDGATQPGWTGSPIVELDGSGAGEEAAGLRIAAGSSTVRGLALARFRSTTLAAIVLEEKGRNFLLGNAVGGARGNHGTGVLVRGDRNTIGGAQPAVRNVISGNSGTGLRIQGSGNLVAGNFIGSDAEGVRAVPNGGDGIAATGGNTIGGTAPAARNIVSGNGGVGISAGASETIQGNFVGTDVTGTARLPNAKGGISGGGRIGGTEDTRPAGPCSGACNLVSGNGGPGVAPAAGAAIQGNFIGTDVDGASALGNLAAGIFVNGAARVVIGGSSPSARNLISGNEGSGIEIAFDAEATLARGNLIGTDAAGAAAVPNVAGVTLRDGARLSMIGGDAATEGNLIAFNSGEGVVLDLSAGNGNAILGNSIHGNGALGIDLGRDGVTPNHGPRPESGPNAFQNFPVLTQANPYSVEGTLDAAPHASFTLQFFSNLECDPSGYGQGQLLIALAPVTTDAAGRASFGVSLTAPPEQAVTATATDSSGNTSEFSPCILPAAPEEETGGALAP